MSFTMNGKPLMPSLNDKQVIFTRNVGRLLRYAHLADLSVILAEAYRTPEQARWYAERGKGIINSAHCKKLAVDLFRVRDGTVSWEHSDYEDLGHHWKTLHPLNRWGGDFRNRDAVHFSMEHQGVT